MLSLKLSQIPKTLDPLQSTNYQHFLIMQCLYDNLISLSSTGDIESEIANSWSISQDGKKYKLKIKNNLFFQNGEKLTVDDVIYSLSRHLWPKSQSIVQFYLMNIIGAKVIKQGEIPKGLVKISDYEFEIHLDRRQFSFLYVLTMPSFGIISKKSMVDNKKVVGSGRMVPSVNSDQISLKIWDKYLGNKTKLESINITNLNGFNVKESEMIKKTFDLAIGMDLSHDSEELKKHGYSLDMFDSLTYVHAFYNVEFGVKDLKVRQCIGKALQEVAKEVSLNNKHFTFNSHFFPVGIMPSMYYRKNNETPNLESCIKYIKKSINSEKKIQIVLPQSFVPDGFVKKLKNLFGNHINIHELGYKELGHVILKKSYDVLIGAYMGNFPDPDGFVEPLLPSVYGTYGDFFGVDLQSEISKVNDVSSNEERLTKYSNLFLGLENQAFLTGLFTIKIPILRNSNVVIPRSTYSYESELWKVFIKK